MFFVRGLGCWLSCIVFLVVEIWRNLLQLQQVFLFDVYSFCFGKMMED